jgi:two-component system CheB/CheR fusion protein
MEQQMSYQQLLNENQELRWQLEEATDAIEAIRAGEVDALIVNNNEGPQLYSLKSADQTYRLFIEKMTEGAVTLNTKGVILYSNSRFAMLVGQPLERVIGVDFVNFVAEINKDKFLQIIKTAWNSDCKTELYIIDKTREPIPCLLSCNAMEFDGGIALSLIITDLTSQKETQQQLELQFDQLEAAQKLTQKLNDELEETVRERTKDLTISREYLKLLTDNIPQMTWTNLPDGEVTFCNQRWCDYTGLTFEETKEKGRWQAIIHPDDLQQTIDLYQESLKTGRVFEVENRYKRADGTYRWHLNRGIPLKNELGEVLFWIGTATDIEDQKQQMDKKDEFIGIASHELKTPLTSLKGYIQIMGVYKSEELPPVIKQYIGKANKAINKLHNLVNDLLDVSKIQAGRLNYTMNDFNLADMINAAMENVKQIYPGYHFAGEIAPKLMVNGNSERLEQVLMNLVSNAVKYSKESTEITIRAYNHHEVVRVSVTDVGIGLSQEQMEKIFERFYRVEDKQFLTSGLGMGLYISSEIINTHKGKIGVESELGNGSTFYFELPMV